MAFLVPLIAGAGAGLASASAGLGTGAAVAIGLSTLGTVGAGVSAMQQGKYNAAVMEQQAEAARRSNLLDEETRRREFTQAEATNIARTLAGGVALTGSPLNVMMSNAYNFERDRIIRRYNVEIGANQAENRANQFRREGIGQLLGSIIGAAGNAATMNAEFRLIGNTGGSSLQSSGLSQNTFYRLR